MKRPVLSCRSVLYVLGLLLAGVTTVWGQEVKNLAASKEGGHLVFFSSQYNDTEWKGSTSSTDQPTRGGQDRTREPSR